MIRSSLQRNVLRSILPPSTLPSRQNRRCNLPTQAVLSAPPRPVHRPSQPAEYYVHSDFLPLTVGLPAGEPSDPLHTCQEMAMAAATSYQRLLERKPLWTKALTCASGQLLGDFIAQACSTGGFAATGFDWHRNLVLTSFAALIGGPTGHFWHKFLEHRVCNTSPKSNRAVFSKLALDQGLMCPAANIVFLSWVHFFMHGGWLGTLMPFVVSSLPPLLVANWKVWPVANTVAFRYIPQDLRIIYQNVLGVAMATYISLLTAGSLS